jgi:hypothetical protein
MIGLNMEKRISICISFFVCRRNDILPDVRPSLVLKDNVLKRGVLSGIERVTKENPCNMRTGSKP